MILPLFLILLFQLAGEFIARLSPFPVPGPVIGMALLAIAFALSPALLARLRPASQAILGNLSLLFVPAGVGIVGHADLLRLHATGVVVAIMASTVLAMIAAALTFQWVARRTGGAESRDA